MCESNILKETGCAYRNNRQLTMHDKLYMRDKLELEYQMKDMVSAVREICSVITKEDQPICTKAKKGACQAIEEYDPINIKGCADIIDLFGKEDIDFLGCC